MTSLMVPAVSFCFRRHYTIDTDLLQTALNSSKDMAKYLTPTDESIKNVVVLFLYISTRYDNDNLPIAQEVNKVLKTTLIGLNKSCWFNAYIGAGAALGATGYCSSDGYGHFILMNYNESVNFKIYNWTVSQS